MIKCPRCSAVLPDEEQDCSACGLSVRNESSSTAIKSSDEQDQTPTRVSKPKARNRIQPVTSGTGRFPVGAVLAGRYQILGLIGKGGMGEVYKAEDLELKQVVALKFLPEELSDNEELLERFRGEVRTARQVSHQNVCRVFDIGEKDGLYYLTMEFIEGDDLAMLLKRIGRLPSDKGIEISREIAMGLNAIHKAGILHRDLKPANIIIDSNGTARITDFGIAGLEEDVQGAESKVGTPAYMSPEQISGKEVTKKSDIYALGLLLYEIFTGKQAFTADTIPGLLEKQKNSQPTNPSEIVTGIDPMVEDLISKCLKKEPNDRPTSALHVAMALPGGNPLQAALEAGETPTPEMIAAAPSKGALKPLVALVLLLGFISGFSLLVYWSGNFSFSAYVPLKDSPEVLAKRAQTIIKNLGYTEPPADRNYRFEYDGSYRKHAKLQANPQEALEKVRKGQPLVYYFQYRQSPEYLIPLKLAEGITKDDPPLTEPGMINVELDTKGRLIQFSAVPGLKIEKTEEPNETDWKTLFDQAGLDISDFNEIEPTERSPVIADETTVWTGTLIDHPDIPVRIEAAGYQGKPVYFNIIPEWKESKSSAQLKIKEDSQWDLWSIFVTCVFMSFLFGSFLLARYNLKSGRVDLRGAVKIAVFFFVIFSLSSLLSSYGRNSAPTIGDKFMLFFEHSSHILWESFVVFVAYMAIEPFCRRRLSDLFISWNRLMIGDFRNPMIGRDILAGLCLGTGIEIIRFGLKALKGYTSTHPINETFFDSRISHLNGIADSLRIVPSGFQDAMTFLFLSMFFILLFSFIFKKKWKSILAMPLLFSGFATVYQVLNQEWIAIFEQFFLTLTLFFVILRFGLVGLFAFAILGPFIRRGHTTFDTSTFYFPATLIIMAVVFSIAIYSYYISTAGKPLFGEGFLEEGG